MLETKSSQNTWWRLLAPLMSSFRQHDRLRTLSNIELSRGLSSSATEARTRGPVRQGRCIFLTKVNICIPNVHSCWAGWGMVERREWLLPQNQPSSCCTMEFINIALTLYFAFYFISFLHAFLRFSFKTTEFVWLHKEHDIFGIFLNFKERKNSNKYALKHYLNINFVWSCYEVKYKKYSKHNSCIDNHIIHVD